MEAAGVISGCARGVHSFQTDNPLLQSVISPPPIASGMRTESMRSSTLSSFPHATVARRVMQPHCKRMNAALCIKRSAIDAACRVDAQRIQPADQLVVEPLMSRDDQCQGFSLVLTHLHGENVATQATSDTR